FYLHPPHSIPPLALHDALPICARARRLRDLVPAQDAEADMTAVSMLACAACFAANVDSPLVDGARWGVWLLLAVTLSVQGAFATDRKSTRLNSSHEWSSYDVFC